MSRPRPPQFLAVHAESIAAIVGTPDRLAIVHKFVRQWEARMEQQRLDHRAWCSRHEAARKAVLKNPELRKKRKQPGPDWEWVDVQVPRKKRFVGGWFPADATPWAEPNHDYPIPLDGTGRAVKPPALQFDDEVTIAVAIHDAVRAKHARKLNPFYSEIPTADGELIVMPATKNPDDFGDRKPGYHLFKLITRVPTLRLSDEPDIRTIIETLKSVLEAEERRIGQQTAALSDIRDAILAVLPKFPGHTASIARDTPGIGETAAELAARQWPRHGGLPMRTLVTFVRDHLMSLDPPLHCDEARIRSAVRDLRDEGRIEEVEVTEDDEPSIWGRKFKGDRVWRLVEKRTQPRGDGEKDSSLPSGYTVAALLSSTGLENTALNRYAKKAGVTTPGRGKKNFKYPLADVKAILNKIIAETSEQTLRERCQQALDNLPNTGE